MSHGIILVGTFALLLLAALVAYDDPSPGGLTTRHGGVPALAGRNGCAVCHADGGLTKGCLGCHTEIKTQLAKGNGLHGTQESTDCASCHPEHHGDTFDLLGGLAWDKESFSHDHVEFILDGAHENASCEACHGDKTFLGRSQDCLSCHEDPHQRKGYTRCVECHDQHAFAPAPLFNHDKSFPLRGAHAEADCGKCHHDRPHFEAVPGRRCTDCHESPHRTKWDQECAACHRDNDLKWNDAHETMTPAAHLATGFSLGAPHARTECKACHKPQDPYADRFRAREAKDCAGCHDNPHRVPWDQDCSACHRVGDEHWRAGRNSVTGEVHAKTGFRLDRPHRDVSCEACHRPGPDYKERFASRGADDCAACHEDVHKGQFAARHKSCLECHERHRFDPPRFGAKEHDIWLLSGAHREAACDACHKTSKKLGARRFAGTPKDCRTCHDDPHKGQFKKRSCRECHTKHRFLPSRIGLREHRTFALTGAHQAVACTACHVEKNGVRRFAKTPASCKSCHEDVHRGQFRKELRRGDCTACHNGEATTFRIRPFDHAKRTGYELAGKHATADCARCHGDGRYRDTPTDCASCHTDVHRAQFRQGKTTDCARCHESQAPDWSLKRFDHRRTRFPLDGRHKDVSCAKCHPTVAQRDGKRVVQYRPLGRDCRSCHESEKK